MALAPKKVSHEEAVAIACKLEASQYTLDYNRVEYFGRSFQSATWIHGRAWYGANYGYFYIRVENNEMKEVYWNIKDGFNGL